MTHGYFAVLPAKFLDEVGNAEAATTAINQVQAAQVFLNQSPTARII